MSRSGSPAIAVAALLVLSAFSIAGCGGGGAGISTSTSTASGRHAESGGEKSIEGFGAEAEGSSRVALQAAFHAYLGAIAARRYPSVCSRLSRAVKHSLSQLPAGRSTHPRCASILPGLLSPSAAAIARQEATGRITKVRVQGGRAFIVFHAPGARLYQLPMLREGGRWKASIVAPSVLVPSAATLGG
jgi:hypothetical protein